jgi:hypothetical protein
VGAFLFISIIFVARFSEMWLDYGHIGSA